MQLKIHGILSFPHIFQARAVQQGDDPKFSCAVLIAKDDPQLAQIQQAIETEKSNKWPAGFPAKGKVCLKDCAVENPDKPNLHNYMVISATSKADQKPIVVDANMQPVLDPSLAYPGAMAWVQINTFTYDLPTSKGVGAGLNGVMLTGQEGPLGRLDNRPTAEQMFGDVGGAAPQAPAPIAGQAPVVPTVPAPVPQAAPQAPAPAPAPAPAAGLVMTAAANGATYEQYAAAGWTDEQMIAQGVAIRPSFA